MIGRADRNSTSPWPGVIERMADGARMARSRVDAETARAATRLSGLAVLTFGAVADEAGDVGQAPASPPPPRTIFTMAESQMPWACSWPQRCRAWARD